jgi:hypothetical protein
LCPSWRPCFNFALVPSRDKNGDPAAAKSRLGAGFDFLLYQKKAGLQQVADEATKEAAAEEEADAGMDDFIPQTPMFSGPKYNTFMLTYFQELDEQVKEEERLMGLSRTPCAPCNAEVSTLTSSINNHSSHCSCLSCYTIFINYLKFEHKPINRHSLMSQGHITAPSSIMSHG